MNKQSLKYIDYAKRRLSVLLAPDTEFSFFAPVVSGKKEIYQVHINIDNVVRIFDGLAWEICNDEDILYAILKELPKRGVRQMELGRAV